MTVELLNGHHPQGRAAPPAPTFTFANGVVGTLHAVSQFTMAHVEIQCRKRWPPPPAPLNEVDYGDGVKKLEPNYSDPEYETDIKRWQAMIAYKVFDSMVELGVDLEVDQAALDRIKSVMEMIGTPLEEISDKVAYIKHCCVRDIASEMPRLREALSALTGPKEEDVVDHVATFQDHVSRS